MNSAFLSLSPIILTPCPPLTFALLWLYVSAMQAVLIMSNVGAWNPYDTEPFLFSAVFSNHIRACSIAASISLTACSADTVQTEKMVVMPRISIDSFSSAKASFKSVRPHGPNISMKARFICKLPVESLRLGWRCMGHALRGPPKRIGCTQPRELQFLTRLPDCCAR